MKKETRHIAAVIIVISTALIGLISLQVYLLFLSYQQKEQTFERNVLNALNSVSQKLEVIEAAGRIFNVLVSTNPAQTPARFVRKLPPAGKHDTGVMFLQTPTQTSTRKVTTDGKKMRIEIFEARGADTTIDMKGSGKKTSQLSFSYGYTIENDKMMFNGRMNDSAWGIFLDSSSAKRKELVTRVVDQLAFIEHLPIEQRIGSAKLDSLLAASFSEAGITLPYSYAVFVGKKDSVMMNNDSLNIPALRASTLKTRLFPNDILSPRYDLAVLFPDRTSFVVREMAMLVLLSMVFMAVIIVCFVYVVRLIFSQKRFGESVVNFINNMTHEFKTPISTIALASEAIAKPETLRNKTKLMKYNTVISDENSRMKRQVDKILQMAVLEGKEFELKQSDVDMHRVIRQAVKNISLQVEQRHGSITAELNADQYVVHGDAVHLTNIIHNLLDNANKYSPEKPELTISTSSHSGELTIVIKDSGIGIDKEHLERVFDKYYRVPTGNTHDVKGFGLGLSYVKLIVEAHGGTISLASTPKKGTTVKIHLPLQTGAQS